MFDVQTDPAKSQQYILNRSSRLVQTEGEMVVNVSWRGLVVTNVNGSLWQSGVPGRLQQPAQSAERRARWINAVRREDGDKREDHK